jgi:hypothetical protein
LAPSDTTEDSGTADGKPVISDFRTGSDKKTSSSKKLTKANSLKERATGFSPPGPGQVHVVICSESSWDNRW